MTLNEALSLTIVGYHVRHDGMAKGAFVHYDFDGFKINNKPFHWNNEDEAANWEVANPSIDNVPGLCQTLWDTFLAANDVEEAAFGINKEASAWLT